jgi:RNA polymerase sigma-70 factor (ECF subfamily)
MDEPLRLATDPALEGAGAAQEAARPTAIDFEDLVHAEHAGLYGALCLIIRDRGEAEDVMQEAFLKVWERWDRVQEMGHPAGYLYRTALNLHRKRRRRPSVAIWRAVGLGPSRDSLADIETRDAVIQALGALTPRQRESVVLVDLLDYTSEEAAELMGIAAATVRVLASQGRAAIKENAGDADE